MLFISLVTRPAKVAGQAERPGRGSSMSVIESLRAVVVDCPLETAAVFSTRSVKSRQYMLVRIRCSDGIEGIGATYCGDHAGELCLVAVQKLLAQVIEGRDPFATTALWEEMYRFALLQGRAGSVMRAISAVDIALWDHNAKAASLPLWRYMGAYHEGSVPAYASGGYYNDTDDERRLVEEMERNCALGFSAMKMKVGRASPSVDASRLKAVREAIGPDRDIMLDANNSWSTVPEAMKFLRRAEDYDPFWIEEPFLPDDIDNHARLAKVSPVPVATGEVEAGHWRFRELIRNEAAGYLQPDVFACGGITEWRRIAAMADACGLSVCTHAWQEFHAPLVAAAPNGLYVEYFPDNRIVNLQDVIDRPVELREGRLALTDEPGLGFDFDEGAVAGVAIAPWEEMLPGAQRTTAQRKPQAVT